jgi:type VI secretion system protein ImpA
MDINSLIELAALPVSDENPCGEDLRLDSSPESTLAQIRSLRSQAKSVERQSRMGGSPSATWREVWDPLMERCGNALTKESKDLEFAVYLTEGLVRTNSYRGLAIGFGIIRVLLTEFWDGLYPRLQNDSYEGRLSFLNALNGIDGEGTLAVILRTRPLTKCQETGVMFGLCHWQHSGTGRQDRNAAAKQKNQTRMLETALTTSPEFFSTQIAGVERALQELAQIDHTVSLVGQSALLHTSQLQSTLNDTLTLLRKLNDHRNAAFAKTRSTPSPSAETTDPPEESEDQTAPEETEDAMQESAPQTPPTQPSPAPSPPAARKVGIQSRREAFELILTAAEYFRRTEPHSPTSYALENIVSWGQMSLPELMEKLIPDPDSLRVYSMLTGLPLGSPPDTNRPKQNEQQHRYQANDDDPDDDDDY